ncbi:PH domain-containing protein [Paraflavisolibacter sp. H34]|uniref:PH domain-containing protein n=1 Tax=Huijunlia imazamoxiresistens TaxID=3127457 RepID=UPI003018DCC7
MSQKQDTLIIRPTPAYALIQATPTLLLFLFSSIAHAYLHMLPLLGFSFVFLLAFAYQYACTRAQVFYITADQIKSQKGIFSRRTDYLELYRVRDFVVKQSLLMRVFRIMNFTMITTDLTSPFFSMTGIPFSDLPDRVRQMVLNCRRNNRVYTLDDQ